MVVAIVNNTVDEMPEVEDWNIVALEFGYTKEKALYKESFEKRLRAYREKLCECIAKR